MNELVRQYPIISEQVSRDELAIILRELEAVLRAGVKGDVVEFGCYVGTTSLFLQRVLQRQAPERQLHLYDSFAGLPSKTAEDASPAGIQFVKGELTASKAAVVTHFKKAHLPPPVIHKAWFDQLTGLDVPQAIAFAFFDGDFYRSILTSLRLVWPRLQAGATVVVDDYHTEALPGVRQAVDEWRRSHACTLRVEASLALIRLI